jgi:probable selenium-dependent hydroxylase accessory protein YqeC
MDLAELLDFEAREHVAFVGAGGKKTAMQHLLERGRERTLSVGYTTTTHMPPPESLDLLLTGEDDIEETVGRSEGSVAFAASRIEDPERAERKVRGFEAETICDVYESNRFDWLLVKADGARRREFKAPGQDEPVIPATATHVLPFASVTVLGNTLDEATVHRPERVAAIADVDVGDTVSPAVVAAVLASPNGALKEVPSDATVTPVLNKADTPALRGTARRILTMALDRSDRFHSGLVTSFRSDVVDVTRRRD